MIESTRARKQREVQIRVGWKMDGHASVKAIMMLSRSDEARWVDVGVVRRDQSASRSRNRLFRHLVETHVPSMTSNHHRATDSTPLQPPEASSLGTGVSKLPPLPVASLPRAP